ncbi:MAG: pseudouridine synthase [Bacillota bacterium]|nr:pseudouridine synthase [Bacillota bacterium]
MAELLRLQKYIAECGVCSRRAAEDLITTGRVHVNGKRAELGQKVDPESDSVFVNGKEINIKRHKLVYIIMNKPRGYVTTMNDELDRKCVKDLLEDLNERVVPVGRLDRDSEGLLILTNDGDLVYKLTHPKHNIDKMYTAVVRGDVGDEILKKLNGPIEIDGYVTNSSEVSVLKKKEDRTALRFILREGRNRQIRKMCDKVGLEVLRLKRVAVGELRLAGVKAGKWRFLDEDEIEYLKQL